MNKTREETVNELVEKCLVELNIASREKYEVEKAERTAAMFLACQMELTSFIEQVELSAKMGKNEIDRVESDRYFAIKSENTDKKITEGAMDKYLSKDDAVREVKKSLAEAEASLKKYNYLFGILTNGFLFFRGMTKRPTNWD